MSLKSVVMDYLAFVNSPHPHDSDSWNEVRNPVYSILHPLRRYSHLLPQLQWSKLLATAVLIMGPNNWATRCYHSWYFCGAIVPCNYCYWNRDGDIMLLVNVRYYYLASVEWIFSDLIDLRYSSHCEECCVQLCIVHHICSLFFSNVRVLVPVLRLWVWVLRLWVLFLFLNYCLESKPARCTTLSANRIQSL